MSDPITPSGAIAWVDDIAPDQAIGICGAKMGRLAELFRAGVNLPKGFTVTVGAYRRHWQQAGLEEVAATALAGLDAGAEPAVIEAAAAVIRAQVAEREMSADLAALIGDAYEELCSRCFEINVPAAVRSSAIGEDPGTAKTDRVVIETSWGWGEAVVQGLVTPDHVEVGKADGRILKYQVADKTV